ncbi:MAG: S8/S53 family peptidase [Bdellovibrio sp.]|nr:S8/S53 family peptidase [Bdellovibrio sp.]
MGKLANRYHLTVWIGLSCFLIMESLANSGSTEAISVGGYWGVDVFYRTGAPDQEKDQLHTLLGTKLYYRSKRFNSDAVDLIAISDNQDLKKLQTLCLHYREQKNLVEKCLINKKPETQSAEEGIDQAICQEAPTGYGNIPSLNSLATTINNIDPTNNCRPFPGISPSDVPPQTVITRPDKMRPDPFGPGRQISCNPKDFPFSIPEERPENDPLCGPSKLSTFWSQEAVGTPEVQELMDRVLRERQEAKRAAPERAKVGIIDGGFGPMTEVRERLPNIGTVLQQCLTTNAPTTPRTCGLRPENNRSTHGIQVSQLIAGTSPVGVGQRSDVTRIASVGTHFSEAVDHMLADPPPPPIVNLSMRIEGDASVPYFEQLSQQTTTVAAAGNFFPAPITEANLKASILVGSLQPNGAPSSFSNEHDAVTISVPVDNELAYSYGHENGNKVLKKFGGTSAATPMVTGALSNVQSFLPGITSAELKKLLEKTAIHTSGTRFGKNGAGSLNAYALLRVAIRLSQNWPANRNAINANTSDADSPYNFIAESERYFSKARRLLSQFNSCANLKEGLSAMRTAFFLDPTNNNIRQELYTLYATAGYKAQAEFYGNVETAMKNPTTIATIRNRSLMRAVSTGDLEGVKKAIKQGADIHTASGILYAEGGASVNGNAQDVAKAYINDPVKRNAIVTYLNGLP